MRLVLNRSWQRISSSGRRQRRSAMAGRQAAAGSNGWEGCQTDQVLTASHRTGAPNASGAWAGPAYGRRPRALLPRLPSHHERERGGGGDGRQSDPAPLLAPCPAILMAGRTVWPAIPLPPSLPALCGSSCSPLAWPPPPITDERRRTILPAHSPHSLHDGPVPLLDLRSPAYVPHEAWT